VQVGIWDIREKWAPHTLPFVVRWNEYDTEKPVSTSFSKRFVAGFLNEWFREKYERFFN
jgi:hypothetical protein